MTSETTTLCICGSGRPPQQCHEMPARLAFAARDELQALGEAHDVAAFFPWLRPDTRADEIVDRAVLHLAGAEGGLRETVEDAVGCLDAEGLRAPSLAWRARYPDRWRRLLRAARFDETALERCFAASAIRAAIIERLPFDSSLADGLEDYPPSLPLSGALSLVIHPALVWDRDDAVLALEARGGLRAPRFGVAERYAPSIVTDAHLERVRAQVAHVGSALPLEARERASSLLTRAVRAVEADEERQVDVACLLLEAYVVCLVQDDAERAARTDRSFRTWKRKGAR